MNGTQSACPQSTTSCPSKQEVGHGRGYVSIQRALCIRFYRDTLRAPFQGAGWFGTTFPRIPFSRSLGYRRKKRSRSHSPQKCQWWNVEITWKVLKEASLFSLVPAYTQSFPLSASSADQQRPKFPTIAFADQPQKQWCPQVIAFQRLQPHYGEQPCHNTHPSYISLQAQARCWGACRDFAVRHFSFLNSYTPNLLGTEALRPAPNHHSIIHCFSFLNASGFSHALTNIPFLYKV